MWRFGTNLTDVIPVPATFTFTLRQKRGCRSWRVRERTPWAPGPCSPTVPALRGHYTAMAMARTPLFLRELRGRASVLDDDKFTPTKHLANTPSPPPHHSSQPATAHTDTETPLRCCCCTKKRGRARRPVDVDGPPQPTDLAHSWATQARPRRRAWARGTVQRHVDAGFSPSTRR